MNNWLLCICFLFVGNQVSIAYWRSVSAGQGTGFGINVNVLKAEGCGMEKTFTELRRLRESYVRYVLSTRWLNGRGSEGQVMWAAVPESLALKKWRFCDPFLSTGKGAIVRWSNNEKKVVKPRLLILFWLFRFYRGKPLISSREMRLLMGSNLRIS